MIFTLVFTLLLTASANAQLSFAGRYSGEWKAKYIGEAAGQEDHEGTWNITIASNGRVTGVEFDRTVGEKGEITGFIGKDGFIKVFVRYDVGTVTIKGMLKKKGARLTGTLKQACVGSSRNCVTMDIILKRK